jgi:hypothetical protein
MINYHTPSPEEIELSTKYVLELIENNKHREPLNPIPLKIKDSPTTASYTQKENVTFNGKSFVSYSGIKHD